MTDTRRKDGPGTATRVSGGLKAALVALATLAVAGAATTPADAQRRGGAGAFRGGTPEPGGGGRGMIPFRQLDLSEAQRQQIQTVMQQNTDAARAGREQMRHARQAVNDAVTTDVVNESEIRSRAARLAALEAEAAVQRAYLYAEIWEILTPDQQARAGEIEAELAARREDRRLWMEQRRDDRRRHRRGGPGA